MFNTIISWSLANKAAVLVIAAIVAIGGIWSIATMKVDILPDINKPTVTVFAESPGMAAEEVERLVLYPLESALAGAPRIERITGNASYAQATINMEFAWGSNTRENHQAVQERLAQAILPAGIKPVLGPSTSLLGEIIWVGIGSKTGATSPMELRTIADWTIRPALLATPGVANVLVMGGDVREWQISINAVALRRFGLMYDDVRDAVSGALTNKSGGILEENEREYAIRILSVPKDAQELGAIAIGRSPMDGRAVRLADIARVAEGASPIRGSGAIDGKPGVIVRVIRQPDAETIAVTDAAVLALNRLSAGLPADVIVHPNLFRQESFIRMGLANVEEALRDGTILVVVVLIVFLMNVRTTAITLSAIPLSILATAIVFKAFGLSVNVMTLGGIAVAIGELVDDAIVDVENIFNRLRQWMRGGRQEDRGAIVLSASQEVRNSIVYATILVSVVFLPIFFLPGIEGKLVIALGTAYLVSLAASMFISLTVTPVLSALLLSDTALAGHEEETRLVQAIKARMTPWIHWCIANAKLVTGATALALALTVGLYGLAGKEGIPPFNEGSLVAMVYLPPGTALSTTQAYVTKLESALLAVPGIRQVSNIAGRAAADPHGGGANTSEVQIALDENTAGDRERIFADVQAVLDRAGRADFSLGQPITHRVEMLLSGVRAPIVVKVFGDDPANMDQAARAVVAQLAKQKGIANARVAQSAVVPEFRVYVDANRLAESGLSSGQVSQDLEMGLMGERIGQVRLGGAAVDVVARYDLESRGSMASVRDLALPFMGAASLGSVGDIRLEGGRNSIDHEGGRRMLVVSANYQGSDVAGAVGAAKEALESRKLPDGVSLSFEGNYKSQKESARRLAVVFVLGIIMIFAILCHAFRSMPIVLLIMSNIPTVLIGGMAGIWLTGGSVNLAHMVGFISLAGIVSRNGIMLIGRSLTMIRNEGKPFSPDTIVEATLDRVVPVLMTSLITVLGLLPLIAGGAEPGKEILYPLSVVVFGGMISSTVISLFLTPALFYRYGEKVAREAEESALSGF